MRIVVTTGLREELSKLVPLALAGIVLGVTSALIVLNHPVEPLDAPLPTIDLGALRPIAERDRAVQREIDRNPLPAEIRAVGSAYLAWNALAASGLDPRDPQRAQAASEIRSAMGVARSKAGDEKRLAEQLSALRAYHTQLFLDELRRAERTGTRSEELSRLSGALLDVLARNGWIAAGFDAHVPEPILRARYKLHWTSIVYGLDDCEHAPPSSCYGLGALPLDEKELAAFLGYLVAHPVVRDEDLEEAGTLAHAIDRRRLIYLDRMAMLDRYVDPGNTKRPFLGSYPYELGRGVLLYRLGRYDMAEDHLRRWVATHPSDGRAKNWYFATIARIRGE